MNIDVAANQARNSNRYIAMEESVRQATYLADALGRVLDSHMEEERLPLPAYREIDGVLSAMRAQLATAFGAYEAA